MEKNNEISVVVKRDGTKVSWDLAKWQAQIAKVCEGVADVSPSMIEMNARTQFHDGMATSKLDEIALRSMVDLIDEIERPDVGNVNYQYAAGKQRITMLRKEVYGQYTVPRLYDIVTANVKKKLYTPDLLTWYTEQEWDMLDRAIDHEKDEELPYAAVEQLYEKYLVQNRVTGEIVETPQIRYMVAAATAFHAEKKDRLKYVKEFYAAASDGLFTLATPVLAGLGTKTKQFSSCVLIRSDDTLKSIFAAGQVLADYASKKAGIGLEVGRLRPLGAPIRNGEIKHTGYIPFLKKWFADLRSCSAGGIRNAAATITYPIWHYQFEDLIVLKNNQGTEENRVRHLDYSVGLSAFFWRRFKTQGNITFFDPNQVPDMFEAFYRDSEEFERLYEKYESAAVAMGLRVKTLPAETVFKDMLLKERGDTGRIYILNVDNVNNQGPFDSLIHPVYQSNLCQEIMQHTRPFQTVDDASGRIALCTLGSINWGSARHPDEMRRPIRILQRMLHNLLQYQDFLTIQSELHNKEFEPLGIGVTNLAYWHAKRKLKYGEPEALAEVKRWMEHMSFYATEGTVDLAEEKGKCLESDNTWPGRGVFTHERRAKGVDELTDFTPSADLQWEALRVRMKKYGVRNATNLALPPVESSSVVINSTNGISMIKDLIMIKGSKAGDFAQVVPEYKKLKNYYQRLWDQPDCIEYLKTVAVMQVYTDQGISSDTFYSPKFFPEGKIPVTLVAKNLMLFHKWGGKSSYYHLIDAQAFKDMINVSDKSDEVYPINSNNQITIEEEDDSYCEACVL
ncbi:ribonucleoside-diphosphate reductase subunit alpha [Acinetobacter sp.]|uniref:ribonucleoside-diphosphate reductase subunit alpha n=1 Tax=Acinetobacter sp. TaxID=472 RepID=UPI00388E31EA